MQTRIQIKIQIQAEVQLQTKIKPGDCAFSPPHYYKDPHEKLQSMYKYV